MEKTFSFFFFLKNTKNKENIKFRKQEYFSENIKMMFSVLLKTVIEKSFKKQESNIRLIILRKRYLSEISV